MARTFRTKLEAWMIPVVEKAMLQGLPLKNVAGLVGCTRQTLMRWRDEGCEPGCPDPLLVELAVTIEEARSKAAQAGVQIMQVHGASDWRAQLEILRAQDPETWAPQTRGQLDIRVEPVQKRDLSGLTDEELLQLEALEAKMVPGERRALGAG